MSKNYTPLLVGLASLAAFVALLVFYTFKLSNGNLSYPLDDTFIHMAVAKNFAQHGVWGITEHGFSSTTSSPLYTLLLGIAFMIGGTHVIIPLLLNLVFAVIFLVILNNILNRHPLSPTHKSVVVLGVILFMPLVILVLSGMEHVLHGFFTLWFVYYACLALSKNEITSKHQWTLAIVSVFMVLSRYEGLFIVLPICLLFFLRRRFVYSIVLGLVALSPVIIYGLISVKSGSHFLPNSLLVKGNEINLFSMKGIEMLYARPLFILAQASWLFTISVILIAISVVRYLILKLSFWDLGQLLIFVFVIATIIHIEFARVGWVYRYEAYLMGLGLMILGIYGKETLWIPLRTQPKYQVLIAIGALLVLSVPIVGRGISAFKFSPIASKNIYEQQVQMGRFIEEYYNNTTVVANDIGAINYLAEIKCIDIIGLGSFEVVKAKREGIYDGEYLQSLTSENNATIAIVYDHELEYSPVPWKKVAEWKIENNKVCASDTVSFYAINESADDLLKNLKEFEAQLPPTVKKFYY